MEQVIPAHAGIQGRMAVAKLGDRLRGNDESDG
jgi:hypothetical protein